MLDDRETLAAELAHLKGQHDERGIKSEHYDVSIYDTIRFDTIRYLHLTSNVSKAHEMRDNQDSNSCLLVFLVFLHPFRRNSLLRCALQPKIAKQICSKNSLF